MGGKQRRGKKEKKRERDTEREVDGEGKREEKRGRKGVLFCTELFPSACLP